MGALYVGLPMTQRLHVPQAVRAAGIACAMMSGASIVVAPIVWGVRKQNERNQRLTPSAVVQVVP
jgi:hypothetical protein